MFGQFPRLLAAYVPFHSLTLMVRTCCIVVTPPEENIAKDSILRMPSVLELERQINTKINDRPTTKWTNRLNDSLQNIVHDINQVKTVFFCFLR